MLTTEEYGQLDETTKELLTHIYWTLVEQDDGCMFDMEESIKEMPTEALVNREEKNREHVRALCDVIHALNWEIGFIQGLRGDDIYKWHMDRIGLGKV